jgi:hypothetical protein
MPSLGLPASVWANTVEIIPRPLRHDRETHARAAAFSAVGAIRSPATAMCSPKSSTATLALSDEEDACAATSIGRIHCPCPTARMHAAAKRPTPHAMSSAQNSQVSAIPPRRGPGRRFVKGRSGNPGGRPRAALDVQELARAHTADAIQTLVDCLNDPKHKLAAACALLDRAWGRPPVFAEVNNVGDQVIRYDIRWADAATNSFPEERKAPTIDATGEAEAPLYHWGDGTPVK